MNPGRRRCLQALGLGLAGIASGLPKLSRGESLGEPGLQESRGHEPRMGEPRMGDSSRSESGRGEPRRGEARLRRSWSTGNDRLAPVTRIFDLNQDASADSLPSASQIGQVASRSEDPGLVSPRRSEPRNADGADGAEVTPQSGTGGNEPRSPGASAATRLLFAGESTLGLVDPTAAELPWQRPHGLPGGAVFRPRALADTLLVAGRGALGAWRLADGAPLWRREAQRQFGVPCLTAEAVFVGDGHELLALDRASGAPRWRFAAIADTQISYAPAATRDKVLVGPGDGRLYALDPGTGEVLWARDRADDWKYLRQLHLASADLLVAGGYTEKLYGIDLNSGEPRWSFSAGNFINSHHVSGDRAFLGSPTGWIYALDVHSGEVRWRHRTTAYRGGAAEWGPLMAELASQDGRLFALDLHHVLHVLDLEAGEELARYPLAPVQPFVTPLSGHDIVVGSSTGELWHLAWTDRPITKPAAWR